MVGNWFAKQPAQKRKRVVRERLIDKRMLPFECLGRAAARLRFVIELADDNIREEFSDGSQSRRFVSVDMVCL